MLRCQLFSIGFTLLLTSCHRERVAAIDRCGASCLPENATFLAQGACRAGTIVCSDGGPSVCVGWVGPSAEICDGLDNDCDGVVDEIDVPCSNACGAGKQRCSEGVLGVCVSRDPSPEVCNGIDDDCDGKVDEVEELPVEFCYSGPPGTVLLGDCHPGTLRCVDGAKVCIGDKTPTPEQCDGVDNNCNGMVDENSARDGDVDVVIILDTSGSMGKIIENVQLATQSWSSHYAGNSSLRFALITAPDPDSATWGQQVRLVGDFAAPAIFQGWMSKPLGSSGSASEPTLDALVDVSDVEHLFPMTADTGGTRTAKLSWRPGARRVAILFTDEVGQSYDYQPPITPASAAAAASGRGIVIHVFTLIGTPSIVSSFEPIVHATGGQIEDVAASEAGIAAALESLIRFEICR